MGDTIKSSAVGEALGNRELQPLASPGYCRLSSIVAAKGERIDWICSSVGLPMHSQIFSSWLSVEVPGKTGLPESISPKMQPSDLVRVTVRVGTRARVRVGARARVRVRVQPSDHISTALP